MNGGGGNNSGGGGGGSQYAVHLRGMPYDCGENEVQQFFGPLKVNNVQILYNNNGRHTGEADAYFTTIADAQEAMKKHKEKYSNPAQLRFDFGDDEGELRQLESNKRYWAKRLDMLDEELKTEPKRIKDLYEIKATRLEPVGLIYLWPVTG